MTTYRSMKTYMARATPSMLKKLARLKKLDPKITVAEWVKNGHSVAPRKLLP